MMISAVSAAAGVAADAGARPASPRLAALAEQVRDDGEALASFWREVAASGTPLVEPVEGDDEDVLVTFLYRGGADVQNVVVFVDRGMWGDVADNTMERLPGTDVWFRTHRFRKDARFTYLLSVNDPLTTVRGLRDAGEWLKRSAGWKPDPLNPRRFPTYPTPLSVVELPGAPSQPWTSARPGAPRGDVRAHKVASRILGNERTVWVYAPPGHDPAGPAPSALLLLFDGGAYNGWIPAPAILDNLLEERRIPPLLAVLVSHPPGARDAELSCSEPFTRFLAEELLPWLREEYRAAPDPALTVVGGLSYGGLAAAYAAFRHPDIFSGVLSQSGGFPYSPVGDPEPGWLIRKFASAPRIPLRFHLDCGMMEDHPVKDGALNIVSANRLLRDVLVEKGCRVHYLEFNGGHEYVNWRGTFADGLIALFAEGR